MELLYMYQNKDLKKTRNGDLGFYFFLEVPFFATTNECIL